MKILITGGRGQLGQALQHVLATDQIIAVDLPEHDITDRKGMGHLLAEHTPDLIINSAAYTNVDGCVTDPELAYRANGLGPQNLALLCQQYNIPLVQISTNEVFNGRDPAPYPEWAPICPPNRYGQSKAAGEFNIRSVWHKAYIVRTAWLYSPNGRNFIHAILRRARETGQLKVVTDEIGNPTYAYDLAVAISQLIRTDQYGTYHFVNSGACSRWAFANEICRLAGLDDVVNRPILSSEFNRPSTPPPYGQLANIAGKAIGIELRPWQDALAECLSLMT